MCQKQHTENNHFKVQPTVATQNIKYLGINLIQDVQELSM